MAAAKDSTTTHQTLKRHTEEIDMSAGFLIKEYSSDPRLPGAPPPVLAEQHVGVGTHPTESQDFSQQTNFIELKLGVDDFKGRLHHEIGTHPLETLVAKWQQGRLVDSEIPFKHATRHVLPVGRGSRIAFLGLGRSSDPQQPAAPKLP
jgi:hypothetical protein